MDYLKKIQMHRIQLKIESLDSKHLNNQWFNSTIYKIR